jgi:hypothetical protein
MDFSGPGILWSPNEQKNYNLNDINMGLKFVSNIFEHLNSVRTGVYSCIYINTNEVQYFMQLHRDWMQDKILHTKPAFQSVINMQNLYGIMSLSTALLTVLHSGYSYTWKKIATYNYHLILPMLESTVSYQSSTLLLSSHQFIHYACLVTQKNIYNL